MPPPVSEDVARARFFAIGMARLAGVAMVLVGILGLRDVLEFPDVAGYLLVAFGLLDIFLVPLVLARKWRSPRE